MASSIVLSPPANHKGTQQSFARLSAALLASFQDRLRQRNFSTHTIRSYTFAVSQYLAFLRSQDPRDNARLRTRHYLENMMVRGLSQRTIAHHLTILREFYRHLNREGIIDRNPILELPMRRGYQRKLPRFLTENEIARLFSYHHSKRDRAMLEFFYSSGCRVGEIVQLQVEDLDFRQRQVLLKGKGNKERLVPFGSKAAMALRPYLQGRTSGPVILTSRGQPMTTR
ncbi:MAG: tyrosine-type recombinase/integrase [Acidobacteria bacterium]|nr:tyrosine-type recombinase/integrase [Acidobacteriota bacterium]